MNKSYVSVWNEALGSWVAASENTVARGKRSKAKASAVVATALVAAASWAPVAHAQYNAGGGTATGLHAIAIGSGAKAAGMNVNSIAMGYNASADSGTSAGAWSATAIGTNAAASGDGAAALGDSATAAADKAIAVGRGAIAYAVGSSAIGAGASATAANSVALGADSIADRGNVVSVGNETLKRQIINVGAGTLSADSTDAVNGSQLYSTNQNVTTNTANIATNTTNIAGNSTAITSIDGRVTNVEGSVTNLTQQLDGGTVGLVQQDATSKAITVARALDGTTVDFTGTDGVRTLTGVKAGALSDTSAEAVNGSQLYATNQNVTANTANIATNTTNIATNTTNIATNTTNIAGNATAITSIDGRVTNVEGSVTNLTQQLDGGSVGLVQQDATSKAITVARDLDGTTVDFTGTDGVRTLTGVKVGALSDTSTEAVNGSQLYATNQNVAANTTEIANLNKAVGNATRYFKAGGLEDGTDDATATLNSVAIGAGAYAEDGFAATTNWNNPLVAGSTKEVNSVAIGSGARAVGGGTALGDTAVTSAFSGVALGAYTVAGSHGTAVGSGAMAQGTDSSALGFNALATASAALAVGNYSTASGANSTALGSKANATTANSVALGAASIADRGDAVSVGNETLKRQIINVGAGTLSADSTDAVNGSQLYSTNQNVTTNTANIATNTANIVTNTTNIAGNATAITSIDGRVTNVEGSVTNLTQQLDGGSVGLVQQDATSKVITVAKGLDGTTVDFSGIDGVRTLSGVKTGVLGDTSTEAVNGSQLYATNQNVAANTASIATNTSNIADNATNIAGLDSRVTTVDNRVTSIDGRVTNVEGSVTNLTQQLDGGSVGLVQQDATSKAITVARALDGTTVDFTGTDGVRTLTGVKAGALSDTSTEAVNGSQLYATNQNVTANTANIATNTANIATNTTNIAGNATAITSIDGRVTNVEGSVTNLTQQLDGGSVGLVQQDSTSKAITVARDLDGTTVDFTGTDGERKLTGVADGAVAAGSKEAINGSQLYANSASVAAGLGGGSVVNPDGTISAPSYSVGGTTVHSVGDAVTNIDGRVTENTTDITKIQNQLGDVGTELSGAVQYDRNADGSVNFNSVTLGGAQSAGPVVLTNVANGASQYDAVNFGQLSALQDQVTDLNGQVSNLNTQMSNAQPGSPYFDATDVPSASSGDGAEVNAAMPGTGVGSTAAGAGAAASGNYATVIGANASAAADNAVAVGASAAATGVNSTAIGTGSQAANTNSVALGQGSVTDRDNSVSVGSAGNERQITNVAAGTAATDAVNVGQMNSSVAQGVQQANNYADQRFNEANRAINDVAKNAYAGIAAAMAMPNMTPSGPGRTIVAAGGATYKGGSAAAVGATYRSRNSKWLVNGAVSVTSTGDAGVRAQVGYEF
ncbi:autotransporter adhesin [Paraburkholderia sp. GAS448]|uniref:ESPR-type extended signal peptide-containing protein n=1 Tax=Paraburkholderia sp. GAS448 TaxID=3035136 RepID=UPI003D1F1905